jgi:hypothetical protein
MAKDDPLSAFAKKFGAKPLTASSSHPSARPLVEDAGPDPYEALGNKVRPVCLELRCHRTGLSHSIPYAHIGAITFKFLTGDELFFTGCGLAVTIQGRNLHEIARAIKLHTCDYVQDRSPDAALHAEPIDRYAAFVELIKVEVLYGKPSPAER